MDPHTGLPSGVLLEDCVNIRRGIVLLFCLTLVVGGMGASCGITNPSTFPKSTPWSPAPVNAGAAKTPLPIALADLDGDTRLDVIVGYREVAGTDPVVIAFFQLTAGVFTPVELRRNADMASIASLATGDIDGDGRLDVVAGCAARIVYLRASADPTVAANWSGSTIDNSNGAGLGAWPDLVIADVDATGARDIVAANSSPGRVSWFRAGADATTGTGWTRFDIDGTTRAGAAAVAVGDLNGDGRTDVYSTASSEAAARVAWYRNPGGDSTTPWTKFTIGNFSNATRMAVGDLNKDGRNDVAVTNPNDGQIGWYLRPLDPTTAWKGYLLADYTSATPVDIAAADIDGNGQTDLVATTITPGTIRWFTPTSQPTQQWIENNLADLSDTPARRIAVGNLNDGTRPDVVGTRQAIDPANDVVTWYTNPE